MQSYKMASGASQKKPYKAIEIPISKFIEEVLPHHENNYNAFRKQMEKVLNSNDHSLISREIAVYGNKKQVKKQLKDLMYDLDSLRTQVEDCDLDKFDAKTVPMRKKILKILSGYSDIEKKCTELTQKQQNDNHLNGVPEEPQIQLQVQLEQDELINAERTCSQVETIQQDVEDLQFMYQHLNQMVAEQAPIVDQVAENTEHAQIQVEEGTRFLQKAAKLKAASYPLAGAFIGTLCGGPIGFLAGLKVGGAAALGCALAGYTGGQYLKKSKDLPIDQELANKQNLENEAQVEKKSI